ncbi:MAG: hypothetical protein OHK93_006266 [Ramalina farinacea]|uniref:Uncharacterized protein n=1 Tax=Ramalina farinacea TaxID=258253 RepID=A0AA43TTD0_9LECA|nr:hypothetical protein [Ramalina farinacea]
MIRYKPARLGIWSPTRSRALAPQQQNLRLFTQNSQFLLIQSTRARPELPFLHTSIGSLGAHTSRANGFRRQIARLLTTQNKIILKDSAIKAAQYSILGWLGFGAFWVSVFVFQTEILERHYPSPHEWGFLTRYKYRAVRKAEQPDENTGAVSWVNVGQGYLELLERLEDSTIEGEGLQPVLKDEGSIYVEGVGKAGLDISAKPEAWRRGYHQCLMGMAKAAENMDDYVKDIPRNLIAPKKYVTGPSFPNPQPVPPNAPVAPQEHNCEPVFPSPEVYYTKILTTYGFTSRQRLDAALAYADWLDYKDLPSTAQDMFDWGLDIAMGSLPPGCNDVVDIKTGIISGTADFVSANIIAASTALASHHARNGDIAGALPIYLSVLRAWKQAESSVQIKKVEEPASTWDSIKERASKLMLAHPYPSTPPTGDEPAQRTATGICEEAGVMSNIGEILFASSTANSARTPSPKLPVGETLLSDTKVQDSGLGWTRNAVDLAEATLTSMVEKDEVARAKCFECLTTSMENWSLMVASLLREEEATKANNAEKPKGSWFWRTSDQSDQVDREKWSREAQVVDDRLMKVRQLVMQEEQRKQDKAYLAILFED